MTLRHPSPNAIPPWVDWLHRLVLHGTPDVAARNEVLETWNAHAVEMYADPSCGFFVRILRILRSGATHSLWRLTQGPATTVSTGLLAALVGFVAAAFVASDPGELVASRNGLTFLGLVLLGYVLVRHPGHPPVKLTLVAFGLLIPSALWTAWEFMTDPQIPAERIAAVGAILCILGAVGFARSAVSGSHQLRAKAWRLFALGIGTFALSNLIGAIQYDASDVRITAAIASWVETLLAASMLRNARSEVARSALNQS